jgi:hypothetical protein
LGAPTSGGPYSEQPGGSYLEQPVAGGPPPSLRFPASPPRRRGRLLVGALVGLLLGALIAGPLGFYLGNRDDSGGDKAAAGPSASGTLSPFHANQLAVNEPKFSSDVIPVARPWLPWVGRCRSNADPGGPPLGSGETSRTLCRYGGVAINFVGYTSINERDLARQYRERLHQESQGLTPGMEAPSKRTAPASGTSGSYVEYGLRTDRVISGIWWNRDELPAAVYVEAFWNEDISARWEPMRGLWAMYS